MPIHRPPRARLAHALLLCASLCCLAFLETAAATDIHRWKDANGVVHYGDDDSGAPPSSATVHLKDDSPSNHPTAATPGKSGGADAPMPSPPKAFGAFSAAQVGQCAGFARTILETGRQPKPGVDPQRKMAVQQLRSTCPGLHFHCTSYNHFPEKNHCDPVNDNRFIVDDAFGYPPLQVPPMPAPSQLAAAAPSAAQQAKWKGVDAPMPTAPVAVGGFSAAQVGQCAGYARAVVDANLSANAGIKTDAQTPFNQFKSNCSGLHFHCTSYYHYQEKNRCDVVSGTGFIDDDWYDYPVVQRTPGMLR